MTQLESMMKNLGLTEAEARALLDDDKKIDKGEKMDFDLSAEQEKNAKKARSTGTKKKPTTYKFEKRQRKEDTPKRELIQRIFEAVKDFEKAEITNPERIVAFELDGEKYEIVLQRKRKPKET